MECSFRAVENEWKRSGDTLAVSAPKSGLATNRLVRKSVYVPLQSQVVIPRLCETLVLFMQSNQVDIVAAHDVPAPLLHAEIIVAVVESRQMRSTGEANRRFRRRSPSLLKKICMSLRMQESTLRRLMGSPCLRIDEVFRKNPAIENLMTKLERILHELWLQEYVWPSIEVFASIYDLICDMMSQYGLVFTKHEEEWRIVMYEDREAMEEARKALDRWTKPPEPQEK